MTSVRAAIRSSRRSESSRKACAAGSSRTGWSESLASAAAAVETASASSVLRLWPRSSMWTRGRAKRRRAKQTSLEPLPRYGTRRGASHTQSQDRQLNQERPRRAPEPERLQTDRTWHRLNTSVEPVDPFGGGEFDVIDAAPRPLFLDQLGLVEAVDRLGQGIVIRRPDSTDRGLDTSGGEPFGEGQRYVLGPAVMVMDQAGQVAAAVAGPGPDGLLNRVEDELGGHRGAGPPAEEAAGVGVDDEGYVDPTRPGRHVGEVGHPQPIRCERREVAVDKVGRARPGRVGDRGPFHPAAARAANPKLLHQPFHRAPGHADAFPVQLQPHLPGAIDAVVTGVDPHNVGRQLLVADLSPRRRASEVVVVGRRGDGQTVLGQHGTHRLDTPHQAAAVAAAVVGADELHDQWEGRSSSAAKKLEAAFRIALARRSSAFSRFSRLSSADSSVVTPGRPPLSTSACRTHLRTVSPLPTPSSCDTWFIAAHSDSCSSRTSATIRTARSFNSGGYRLEVFPDMTPTLPRFGVSGHAGRFTPIDRN